MYIATALGTFLGLSIKGGHITMPAWKYFDQLTLRSSRMHYRRVQNASLGIICYFNKDLPKKCMLEKA